MSTSNFFPVRLQPVLIGSLLASLIFTTSGVSATPGNPVANHQATTATAEPGEPELVHPEFPGGDAALIQFLGQNLTYPPDAYREGVEGRVVVSFWIDEQGHPYGFGVLQPLHPSLDAEALRALKKMPDWAPGARNGKAAPMVVHVPVVFRRPGSAK